SVDPNSLTERALPSTTTRLREASSTRDQPDPDTNGTPNMLKNPALVNRPLACTRFLAFPLSRTTVALPADIAAWWVASSACSRLRASIQVKPSVGSRPVSFANPAGDASRWG